MTIQKGTLIDYRLRIHGIPFKWRTLIEEWNPKYSFVDTQLKGPYRLWHHTHTFVEKNGGVMMIDTVKYEIPFGFLGRLIAGTYVKNDVKKIFNYRKEAITQIFGA